MNIRLRDLLQSYADAVYRIWISRRSYEGLPAEAARDRRVRRGLAATLSLLGFVVFVEVVLAPGLLFRWPLHTRLQGGEQSEPPIGSTTWFPGLANKDSEQALRRQRLRDAIRARLGEHQKAIAALLAEWDRTCRTARSEIGIDIADQVPERPAPAQAAIVLDVPTGRAAWSSFRQSTIACSEVIADANAQQSLVADRLALDTFLPEDDAELAANTAVIRSTATRVRQMRDDVEHMSFLVRARARVTTVLTGTTAVP